MRPMSEIPRDGSLVLVISFRGYVSAVRWGVIEETGEECWFEPDGEYEAMSDEDFRLFYGWCPAPEELSTAVDVVRSELRQLKELEAKYRPKAPT